jgi:hypothetical protein
MPEKSEVSSKNTKSQILEAYYAAMSELKKSKNLDAQAQQKQEDQRLFLEQIPTQPVNQLEDYLHQVKQSVNQQLGNLLELLIKENATFLNLKKAVQLEEEHLKKLYDIKVQAHSLEALMIAQEKEKERFEAEKKNYMAGWEQTKKDLEKKRSQEEADLKLARKREENDYQYELSLSRRKEMAEFEAKKAKILSDMDEKSAALEVRENELKNKEAHIQSLEEKVSTFPEELEKMCKEAKAQVKKQTEEAYNAKTALREKEIEGEQNLMKLRIESLEQKIKELEKNNQYLIQKSDHATAQVQDIACKALESSSERLSVVASHKFQETKKAVS